MKEVEKIKAKGEEKKPKLANKNMTWALPSHIITFLMNSLENIDEMRLKLAPWPDFKKTLFDIYDHRIENAPEINGAINTTYMTLDEHLLVYMCSCGGARFGSREDIEKRLLEFLYSLKYYCQRWARAMTYAKFLGFIKENHTSYFSEMGRPKDGSAMSDKDS